MDLRGDPGDSGLKKNVSQKKTNPEGLFQRPNFIKLSPDLSQFF
jgi:hypothetical protein